MLKELKKRFFFLKLAYKYPSMRKDMIYLSCPPFFNTWERLTRKRYLSTQNTWIQNRLFHLYLVLTNWKTSKKRSHTVYDQYGPIDTLGWEERSGRHTSSYHDEMESVFTIHPFNLLTIAIHDGCCFKRTVFALGKKTV